MSIGITGIPAVYIVLPHYLMSGFALMCKQRCCAFTRAIYVEVTLTQRA